MTRFVALVGATLLLVLGSTQSGAARAPMAAAQDPGLTAGIRQVDEGDFEGAVATLVSVADRMSAKGGHEAAQACLYLGIAHLALDQRADALGRFRQALGHEPSLRLDPVRFSPKVLAAFEEARAAREAQAHAVERTDQAKPEPRKGHAARTVLIGGGAVAAGVGIALAAGGRDAPSSGGAVTFTGTRFGTPVLECPNGTTGTPLVVAVDINAQNGGGSDVTISTVSAVLIIVASPAVPGEVGFASNEPAMAAPITLRPGTTTLRVQTTLTCANGPGDASRFNEWRGRVTLSTAGGAQSTETVDTLRVNLP